MQFKVLRSQDFFLIPLYIAFLNLKKVQVSFFDKKQPTWGVKCEKLNLRKSYLLDKLRKLYRNGTCPLAIFQPSSSYRKFQAFLVSPNRYFTENSCWVLLLFPRWLVKLRDRTYNGTRSAKTDDRVLISKRFFEPHRLSEIIVTIN